MTISTVYIWCIDFPPPAKSPSNESRPNLMAINCAKDSPALHNPDDMTGFQYPKRRKRRKRQNVLTGKATNNISLKGAPETSRDIFVYRVDQSTTVDQIQSHISENGIAPVSCVCVSNPDAKFKSFKISVPVSQCNTMFNPDIWPAGIRVRKFYHPKNVSNGDTRNN